MTVAIVLPLAAVVGRLSRSLPFAIWLLLAPSLAYSASPRWVRLHLWGSVTGVHTGHRAAPKKKAVKSTFDAAVTSVDPIPTPTPKAATP
jgi:hypothetical protein